MKTLITAGFLLSLSALAFTQTAPPANVTPADAKNHVGETATVCGKVVDTKAAKYGIAGRGKPVIFVLDKADPTPLFYFVSFGTADGGPDEVIAAYNGKHVCVSGKIATNDSGPYIMAADRTQIKTYAAKTDK
jgi:hypothetical protein